ncbi:tetratricopeptide repeat protein [Paraburkholderia sp. ZP32-5]|uniref:tetratricopeptide repeat protein n=1 Tax=Paraburkholderia sp. ZP32-5 TaxID=2883245 RepID=UPI001F490998|nr:tetratricopeptide repeat protein [Paraburkholderia sp. ZP32-5]
MKRLLIHATFGTVAICCAAWGVSAWVRLQHAGDVNRAIAAVNAPHAASHEDHASDDDAPQIRLARATALSKAGAYDAAARLYNGLIHEGRLDDVGRAALFDLGNMYLRQGSGDGNARMLRSISMVNEAKVRYRLVLRSAPGDWDARYNLERALWLAPEGGGGLDQPDVKEQHNVTLRDAQSMDLP